MCTQAARRAVLSTVRLVGRRSQGHAERVCGRAGRRWCPAARGQGRLRAESCFKRSHFWLPSSRRALTAGMRLTPTRVQRGAGSVRRGEEAGQRVGAPATGPKQPALKTALLPASLATPRRPARLVTSGSCPHTHLVSLHRVVVLLAVVVLVVVRVLGGHRTGTAPTPSAARHPNAASRLCACHASCLCRSPPGAATGLAADARLERLLTWHSDGKSLAALPRSLGLPCTAAAACGVPCCLVARQQAALG